MSKYQEWISTHIKGEAGFCQSSSHEMAKAFPELRVVRGYVETSTGSKRDHWWCETPDGTVVDPTVGQFDSQGGVWEYDEYSEEKHGPLPNSKCINCGGFCYGKWHTVCSDRCGAEAVAYLSGGF